MNAVEICNISNRAFDGRARTSTIEFGGMDEEKYSLRIVLSNISLVPPESVKNYEGKNGAQDGTR
ncbi:hypothetical protein IVB38_16985 [Bradyrhizobium sp. 38]|uniref:hypothetical protein n=1 Tax=unclassified Bradyrhizobium TaxID=2631580 RepID=UPI001FF9CBBD|nr:MULTISPECIES: hypothetical protein [unclassified Bradyrhizobium]MCK1337676.1 hypothetical protein [Bradyrhizobium sp. 38]MCK1775711.1 hypothetical protein [Bradyrhizobium sp. 132]